MAGDRGRGDTAARPAAPAWRSRPLRALLAEHDLGTAIEMAFPNDGWSGATLTALEDRGRRFILKRTSPATDWIVRSTQDSTIREAVLAAGPDPFRAPLRTAHLGAAADEADAAEDIGTTKERGVGGPSRRAARQPGAADRSPRAAILMRDLTGSLLTWNQGAAPGGAVDHGTLERVLAAMAELHAQPWTHRLPSDWPWCPTLERVSLLTRASAERYAAEGVWVGGRFLEGWDAFDRVATRPGRELVAALSRDPRPLVDELAALPATGLHGDLKLANVALHDDGGASFIDWQMTAHGPVALELGWFLVANVAQLPDAPDQTLARYFGALHAAGGVDVVGDPDAQRDLAIIVGLLLRGWRKGLDAESGIHLPTGVSAQDDLAWWCAAAVEAAARRL